MKKFVKCVTAFILLVNFMSAMEGITTLFTEFLNFCIGKLQIKLQKEQAEFAKQYGDLAGEEENTNVIGFQYTPPEEDEEEYIDE